MSKIAAKRLQKEYKALIEQPAEGINAVPREENILIWDCAIALNIPNHGKTAMHMVMEFSDDYPIKAPSVGFSCPFNYQDGASYTKSEGTLAGKFVICLNVLGNFAAVHTEWASKKGEGWSPASSVTSLLVTLQSVLMDSLNNETSNAKLYNDCESYRKNNYVPGLEEEESEQNETSESKAPAVPCPFTFMGESDGLGDELKQLCIDVYENINDVDARTKMVSVVDFLLNSRRQHKMVMHTETSESAVVDQDDTPVFDPDIRCIFYLKPYTELLLGVGIILNTSRPGRVACSTTGDFISYRAFSGGCRHLPSKESCHKFLPVWINRFHSIGNPEWLSIMNESIISLGRELEAIGIVDAIIRVYSLLMHDLILKMSAFSKNSNIRASIKQFNTLMDLWRCFLYHAESNTSVRDRILRDVSNFIRDPQYRRRNKVPHLGWILVMASALNKDEIDFSALMVAYEEENLLRKVYFWDKNGIELTPENTYSDMTTSDSHYCSLLFYLFYQKIVFADRKVLFREMEVSNGTIVDRLEELLSDWKEIKLRLTEDSTWKQYYTELHALGYPQETMERIIGDTTSYIVNIVQMAIKLKDYVDQTTVKIKYQAANSNSNYNRGTPQTFRNQDTAWTTSKQKDNSNLYKPKDKPGIVKRNNRW